MQPRGGQILLARVSFLVGFLIRWFHLALVRSGFVFISILVPPAPRACPGRPPRTRPLPGSRAGRRPRSGSPSSEGGEGREVPLHRVASPLALGFAVAEPGMEQIPDVSPAALP